VLGPLSRSLSILTYHRVVAEPDALVPDHVCAADFDWQLAALARWFRVLPLREAVSRLRAGTLPARAASVTFDDGYADNANVALPLLLKHGLPATFFVATGFLDGGRMWNDSVIETIRSTQGGALDADCLGLGALPVATLGERRQAMDILLTALKYLPPEERERKVEALAAQAGARLPVDLMMASEELRSLRASGMDVGAHTVTHPILARVDRARAQHEIRESKRLLEAITGSAVTLFAYPNGRPGRDYLPEHVRMVREAGYEAGFSTAQGVAHAASDPLQLPRFSPWDRTPGRFVLRLMHNTFRTAAAQV
jgi:peptidoglycan/xylan/chitin deacetylase (PgdA/CDA1 family)